MNNKTVRAKDLTFSATGLQGRFICRKNITTTWGPTSIYSFDTPEVGEITIWENARLKEPLSQLKRDDDVVIIHQGSQTLNNGHVVEDYKVYRLMS
jgi:hypothetical protein